MGKLRDLLRIKPVTDTKLPEGFKNKWIEALESGKYIQGKDFLLTREEDKKIYCCLGVAAKICEVGDENIENTGLLCDLEDSSKKRFPFKFVEDEDLQDQLVRFNDGTNDNKNIRGDKVTYTFPQIAQWIKKYL